MGAATRAMDATPLAPTSGRNIVLGVAFRGIGEDSDGDRFEAENGRDSGTGDGSVQTSERGFERTIVHDVEEELRENHDPCDENGAEDEPKPEA